MANRIRRSLVMRVGIRVVMRPPNACGDGVRSSSSLVAGGSSGISWWRRARRRGSRVAEEDVLELASCRPPAGDQKRQRCRRRWGREALLPKRRKSGSGATDARPGARQHGDLSGEPLHKDTPSCQLLATRSVGTRGPAYRAPSPGRDQTCDTPNQRFVYRNTISAIRRVFLPRSRRCCGAGFPCSM